MRNTHVVRFRSQAGLRWSEPGAVMRRVRAAWCRVFSTTDSPTVQAGWKVLWGVLAGCCLSLCSAGATTYYAAVNGSSSNTGLSSNSPWPLNYALANCGASNTVIVLPGTYSYEAVIAFPYVTLKSQTKWAARIVGGAPFGVVTWPQGTTHHATIDGFEIASSSQCGVALYSPNCIVRNCWIHNSGTGRPTQDSSGIIFADLTGGHLVENNISENNGFDEGGPFDHGVYITGTGSTVRNNVFRHNWGCGMALRETSGANYIYNNLTFNNHYYGFGGSEYPVGTKVYFCNNTMVESNITFYGNGYATYYLTNNILFGGVRIDDTGGMLTGDYNLMNGSPFSQAHGKVVSSAQFVNPATGLYWLSSSSPARGMALANIHGPMDFFGNPLAAVTDVGAFQYSAAYAADTRVLEPSPVGGADYWQLLGGTGGGTSGLVVSPTSQSFGPVLVGTAANCALTVQNTGSASLSGSASVSAPFAIVSGSPYSLAPGQSQTVTVRFAPTVSGPATQSVIFTSGLGANATATVSGTATNAPAVSTGGFTFQASAGLLTAPFIVTNGYVCQLVDTDNVGGGRAVYNFTTTTAGVYLVSAVVNAPDTSHNSFYVTMDGTPVSEPYTVWDVPTTSGFQSETVAWRANGTWDANEFAPKAFALSAGPHSLVIVGRESNTQLQSIQIQPSSLTAPTAAPVLRLP